MRNYKNIEYLLVPYTSTSPRTESPQLRTVMICDDEQDLLLTYSAILEEDYSIITTSSGTQCVETYVLHKNNGQKIHLILLDYKLPDRTGDQVAKEIKLLNGTRIILISAYQLKDQLIDELKENKVIVEFLSKPISVASLKETVNRVVSGLS